LVWIQIKFSMWCCVDHFIVCASSIYGFWLYL